MHVMIETPPSQFRQQTMRPAPLGNVITLHGGGWAAVDTAASTLVYAGIGTLLGFWLARQQKISKKQRWQWSAGGAALGGGAGWLFTKI